MDAKWRRGHTERISESASCRRRIMVWAFALCFKGCGPQPKCSNHNQMGDHITDTEVACYLQTNNTVLFCRPALLLLSILIPCFFSGPRTHHRLLSMLLTVAHLSLLPPSIPLCLWCALICRLSSSVGQLLISWTSHCPQGHPSVCVCVCEWLQVCLCVSLEISGSAYHISLCLADSTLIITPSQGSPCHIGHTQTHTHHRHWSHRIKRWVQAERVSNTTSQTHNIQMSQTTSEFCSWAEVAVAGRHFVPTYK